MPCNGIAVGSARINMDIARLLAELDIAARQATIGAALQAQYPELAGKQVKTLRDTGNVISFQIGQYKFAIQDYGRITVYGPDYRKRQAMAQSIKSILNSLAGVALQGQIVQRLQAAGVKVNQSQRANNGALVLSVEV